MKKNTKISLIISVFLMIVFSLYVVSTAEANNGKKNMDKGNRGNHFGQMMRHIAPFKGGPWSYLFGGNNSSQYGPWKNCFGWANCSQNLVQTKSASNVKENEATLNGVTYFKDVDYVYVWFEYGNSYDSLNNETAKVKISEGDDTTFSKTISGLNDDTKYYFRAVGQKESGNEVYGVTLGFMTSDNSNDNDIPEVTTSSASNIGENSAKVKGTIDMNDYDNGIAFFVYGEDQSKVTNISNNYNTFSSIVEDGDNLKKVVADSDIDGTESYSLAISNLDDNTKHYYSMCVQYENSSSNYKLICGSVKNFTTDAD